MVTKNDEDESDPEEIPYIDPDDDNVKEVVIFKLSPVGTSFLFPMVYGQIFDPGLFFCWDVDRVKHKPW